MGAITLGKWYEQDGVVYGEIAPNKQLIAAVYSRKSPNLTKARLAQGIEPDEAEANAKAIAAVPDMIEALQDAAQVLAKDIQEGGLDTSTKQMMIDRIKQVLAVI